MLVYDEEELERLKMEYGDVLKTIYEDKGIPQEITYTKLWFLSQAVESSFILDNSREHFRTMKPDEYRKWINDNNGDPRSLNSLPPWSFSHPPIKNVEGSDRTLIVCTFEEVSHFNKCGYFQETISNNETNYVSEINIFWNCFFAAKDFRNFLDDPTITKPKRILSTGMMSHRNRNCEKLTVEVGNFLDGVVQKYELPKVETIIH